MASKQGSRRMWRMNNIETGVNTHCVVVNCPDCGQDYNFWLNQNKGMKDPIFSICQAEMDDAQPCPNCSSENAIDGQEIRGYNIYEN